MSSITEPERILTLYEDDYGNLYIGTSSRLLKYSPGITEIETVLDNTGIINNSVISQDGNIYISTESKGFVVIASTGEKYYQKKNETFSFVVMAPDNKVWTTTTQGVIYCYDPVTNTITSKTSELGLTGEIIHGIEADKAGIIWVLTDKKIIKYYPLEEIYEVISSYDYSVGFNSFLCLFKDENGIMYVGGTGGILVFDNYETFGKESYIGKVSLTSVKINGMSQKVGYNLENINLKPNERNVELHFSTFDHLYKTKIRYAYRYQGSSSDWSYLQEEQNTVYLNELSKGIYEIEVKATDRNGYWSENVQTVHIKRLPSWYESWWAFVLYATLIIVILLSVVKKYIEFQKSKEKMRINEELSHVKYRFFTNISHELRTPLTLIITPLESIIKKLPDSEIKDQLQSVRKNARSLMILVNQLLDFRKIESEKEVLHLSHGDLKVFLHSVFHNFILSAAEKNIRFEYKSEIKTLSIVFDHDKLKKIIYNLLSNALKFTNAGGKIIMSLDTSTFDDREYACIKVADSGMGIPEEDLESIFDPFYQVGSSHENSGSGIGLHLVREYTKLHEGKVYVESKNGKGSVFTVLIPLDLHVEGEKSSPDQQCIPDEKK